jgi:acetyl-CoA synthetase
LNVPRSSGRERRARGAPFTQVYSGFSREALAERMRHLEAKVLVTSDGLWRRGKIVDLKGIADSAVGSCPSIQSVIVVKRTGHDVNMESGARAHLFSDKAKS